MSVEAELNRLNEKIRFVNDRLDILIKRINNMIPEIILYCEKCGELETWDLIEKKFNCHKCDKLPAEKERDKKDFVECLSDKTGRLQKDEGHCPNVPTSESGFEQEQERIREMYAQKDKQKWKPKED